MLRMNEQQFQDVAEDVLLELVKFGEVQEYWIVKPYQATIGSNRHVMGGVLISNLLVSLGF